jgi:plasmid stabilization system protein ParE
MPQVRFSPAALRDLERLRELLGAKNPAAAKRAAAAIAKSIQLLGQQPQIGRPIGDLDPAYRELPITFGNTGYIARYRYADDTVTILRIHHQREADH